MKIYLNNLKYYYLTVPNTVNKRKEHILNELKDINLQEVNPIPYNNFNKNLSKFKKTRKSGNTGFLKILDLASKNMTNNFQPFVIFEDDVKKYRDFPEFIDIPENSDLLYLGLSLWGMKNNNKADPNCVCYKNIDSYDHIIRIYNMLSLHGIMICSLRGLLTLQKCLLEDFYKCQGWDISIAQAQPYLNVYALKEPLVYQFGEIGGIEKPTKINYKQLQEKSLPEKWKNNNNLSIITMYK